MAGMFILHRNHHFPNMSDSDSVDIEHSLCRKNSSDNRLEVYPRKSQISVDHLFDFVDF